jgi:hypothetical protein
MLLFFGEGWTPNMVKRVSVVTASVLTFVFLIVSIAHACSGLAPVMSMAVQQSPMNMGVGDDSPCGKEKRDICQSVRDSILSTEPSISAVDSLQQWVPLLQLSVDHPNAFVPSFAIPAVGVFFHPVFKLPLTLSYLVLRI